MSWRMMLRTRSGTAIFRVAHSESKKPKLVKPRDFLTRKQYRRMATHPDMIWQFAQWLKRKYEAEGKKDISIKVRASVRVNQSKFYPIIYPCTDLAKVKWKWYGHNEWIIPYPPEYDGPKKCEE